MYIAGVPTIGFESRIYIASAPAVGCESKNVSLEMYIAGAPTIGYESKDVYRWCAHYRMRVQRCISLVRPL